MATRRAVPAVSEDLPRLLDALGSPSRPRALRAKSALLAQAGHAREDIARELGVPPHAVEGWLDAYAREGLRGLLRTRGRRRTDPDARVARVRAALDALAGEPDVTVRRVARLAELPATTTYRLMREMGERASPRVPEALAPAGTPSPPRSLAARVVVAALGASGARTLRRVGPLGTDGVASLLVDTDVESLGEADADTKLLIAKAAARGRGSGGDVSLAARGAEAAAHALEEMLAGAKLVLVTTGLGGGTGTGASPVVARVARARGALVVALVSMPFHVERARLARAEEGLRALEREADCVVAVASDRLLQYVPNLPLDQAFRVMDTLLAEVITGIVDTLARASHLEMDHADVRDALAGSGRALLLYGEARAGDGRAVVREALHHAFVDGDVATARGALIHLAGGPEMSLSDAESVRDEVAARLAPGARLAWGARASPALAGRLRLTIIAAGVGLTARTP